MTDRLTLSRRDREARWPGWMPAIFTLMAFVALVSNAPFVLQRTSWESANRVNTALSVTGVLLMLWGSGAFTRRLLPTKSPAIQAALAHGMGCGITALWMHTQGFSLSPDAPPKLLAWGLSVSSLWLWMDSASARWLAGPAGFSAAVALTVDTATLPFLIPLGGWALGLLARAPKREGGRVGLVLLGMGVGLLPILLGRIPFVCPYRASGGHPLPFPWPPAWSWFFLALGGGVALAQRIPAFLGFALPGYLLGIALHVRQHDNLVLTLVPAWICAYGIFRLCRGVETGWRNLNPSQARALPSFLVLLLLLALSLWTAWLYLQP